jgi:hypothetical protein
MSPTHHHHQRWSTSNVTRRRRRRRIVFRNAVVVFLGAVSYARVQSVEAFGSMTAPQLARTSAQFHRQHFQTARYATNDNQQYLEEKNNFNGKHAPVAASDTTTSSPITMDQLMPDDESSKEALLNAVNTTVLMPDDADDDEALSSSSLVSSSLEALSSSSLLLSADLSPEHPFAPPLTYKKFLTMQVSGSSSSSISREIYVV